MKNVWQLGLEEVSEKEERGERSYMEKDSRRV
jgi:hypothetical protein